MQMNTNQNTMFQERYTLSQILGRSMSRKQALKLIQSDPEAYSLFQSLPDLDRNKIIGFIQGNQGLKILHDKFSQHVFQPHTHPERLEHLLSALLGQEVQIQEVLSREGNMLADKGSFVVMDFLVELSDGTRVNVEVQRVGYAFPGERSCCYTSDAIMRQYNEVRSDRGKAFSFQDMKPVLLVILMETSAKAFLAAAPHYIHREQHTYDSGAKVLLFTGKPVNSNIRRLI